MCIKMNACWTSDSQSIPSYQNDNRIFEMKKISSSLLETSTDSILTSTSCIMPMSSEFKIAASEIRMKLGGPERFFGQIFGALVHLSVIISLILFPI